MNVTEILGTIEPCGEPSKGRDDWIRLIDDHASLSRSPPRAGSNPFTKKPMEFHGHRDSARVTLGNVAIGAIYWAMDGSRCLVVNSNAGSESDVITIARGVAAQLGWRYIERRGV
jgi:hypothetical protein